MFSITSFKEKTKDKKYKVSSFYFDFPFLVQEELKEKQIPILITKESIRRILESYKEERLYINTSNHILIIKIALSIEPDKDKWDLEGTSNIIVETIIEEE